MKIRRDIAFRSYSHRRRVATVLLASALFFQVAFIFYNSHKDASASDAQSSVFVRFLSERILGLDYSEMSSSMLGSLNHFVRKAAHFTEFAVLGVLASAFCVLLDVKLFPYTAVFSSCGCFIVASLDEFSQKFSDGRACRFSDVLIDTSGGVFGVLCVALFVSVLLTIKNKNRRL